MKEDFEVIKSFSYEWSKFTYEEMEDSLDLDQQFANYTNLIDFNLFDKNKAIAADFGAGSGRWTKKLLRYFSHVYAIEPSPGAFSVLERKFNNNTKVTILNSVITKIDDLKNVLDFALCLGVIHHLEEPKKAIRNINYSLKPGGYFLCYVYYNLENQNLFNIIIFRIVNVLRKIICKLPNFYKIVICNLIALFIYLPLAKIARVLKIFSINVEKIPLHQYSNMSFYVMRNDSLDRFGTKVENRYSTRDIIELLNESGFDLQTLKISNKEPYYVFLIQKALK